MEPEWTWPYFQENYTGPWLSDGKIQSSVAHGKTKPRSKLDRLSREHDTAYALARSAQEQRNADLKYYKLTREMSWFPRLAGNLVLYVNDPTQIFNAMAGWGENMGNTSGKERADKLRKENNQVDGKDILVARDVTNPQQSVPIYYEPKSNGSDMSEQFTQSVNVATTPVSSNIGSSNMTSMTTVYYPAFDQSNIFNRRRKKRKKKKLYMC